MTFFIAFLTRYNNLVQKFSLWSSFVRKFQKSFVFCTFNIQFKYFQLRNYFFLRGAIFFYSLRLFHRIQINFYSCNVMSFDNPDCRFHWTNNGPNVIIHLLFVIRNFDLHENLIHQWLCVLYSIFPQRSQSVSNRRENIFEFTKIT